MEKSRAVAAWLLVFALALGVSNVVHAQQETVEIEAMSPEQRTALAREHFQLGLQFFNDHNYREAVREFHLAARAVPSADIWFNIARAHEEMNELEPAIEHYELYLRDRVDPPDRDQVTQRIQNLRERSEAARAARRGTVTDGTVRIRSEIVGAAVRLDDNEVGTTPVEQSFTVAGGRHSLDVRREGYIPFRSELRVEAGSATAAYVDLAPRTEYRAIRGDRIFTWIAGGLSVVALGFMVGLGAEAASRSGDDDFSGARRYSTYSDYALGAAIGLGVGAFALYFLEGRSIGTERVTANGAAQGSSAAQ